MLSQSLFLHSIYKYALFNRNFYKNLYLPVWFFKLVILYSHFFELKNQNVIKSILRGYNCDITYKTVLYQLKISQIFIKQGNDLDDDMCYRQIDLIRQYTHLHLDDLESLILRTDIMENIWKVSPSKFSSRIINSYVFRTLSWKVHNYFFPWVVKMVKKYGLPDTTLENVLYWFYGDRKCLIPYAQHPYLDVKDVFELSLILENKTLSWDHPVLQINRTYVSDRRFETKILGSIFQNVYEHFDEQYHWAMAFLGVAPENNNDVNINAIYSYYKELPILKWDFVHPLVKMGIELNFQVNDWLLTYKSINNSQINFLEYDFD